MIERSVGFQKLAAAVVVGLCASAACSTSQAAPSTKCGLTFLGDPNKAVELELTVWRPDGGATKLLDGQDVPLTTPPQGGRVLFIGARATNIDPCGVILSGSVGDPIRQESGRVVDLIPDGAWGSSGAADQATASAVKNDLNIPLCPNQWSDASVPGTAYTLEASILDTGGRMAARAVHITPRCDEPERLAECLCICKAGYQLGDTCGADGGSAD